MLTKIKKQWNRFKKWLWLLIFPVALASTVALPETPTVEQIVLENGRVISFPYTDSLDGETIHIYTDRSHYNQNVGEAEIYFAITVDKKQDIDFGVLLDGGYTVSEIELLVPQIRTIYTPVYKEECEKTTIISDRTSKPIEQEVCTSALVRTDETYEEYYGSESELFIKKEQEIDEKDKYKITENVDKGIHYGKITIPITENVIDEEFWLFAVDEDGVESILDPWFSSSWGYKKKIEVNPAHVDATLTSYPVFIDLSNMGSDFFDNTKADGCDIRIVESDDSTETAFELVAYNAVTDTGELHFMGDSVSGSATTTYYMYYGNAGASCYAANAVYGSEAVWSDYKLVLHMQENPSGSSPQMLDSTANDNDGATQGTMTSGDSVAGKLSGKAIDFDGTDDYLSVADSVSLGAVLDSYTTAWTVQTWSKGSGPPLWGKMGSSGWTNNNFGADILSVHPRNSGSYEDRIKSASASLNNGSWHFSVWQNTTSTTANDFKFFVDGTQKTTANNENTLSSQNISNSTAVHLNSHDAGAYYNPVTWDEFRIRLGNVASTWISTEYNNQDSPSTFYFVGAQETGSAPPAVAPQVPALPHYWDI